MKNYPDPTTIEIASYFHYRIVNESNESHRFSWYIMLDIFIKMVWPFDFSFCLDLKEKQSNECNQCGFFLRKFECREIKELYECETERLMCMNEFLILSHIAKFFIFKQIILIVFFSFNLSERNISFWVDMSLS